jgi:hypothetical protein
VKKGDDVENETVARAQAAADHDVKYEDPEHLKIIFGIKG